MKSSSLRWIFATAAVLTWEALGLCAYIQAQTQAGEKGSSFNIDPENSVILVDTTEHDSRTRNILQYFKNKMAEVDRMQKYELESSPERLAQYKDFLASFDSVRDADLETKLEAINRTVNELIKGQPEEDTDNWQTPCVSVIEKKGDCEDYAILKGELCRYLGLDPRRIFMGLVGAYIEQGINHAVIYYDGSIKNDFSKVYVLDNLELIVKSAQDQKSHIEYVIRISDGESEAMVASRNKTVQNKLITQGPG